MLYITTLPVTISGIPAQLGVTFYQPYIPARFGEAPDWPEVEFDILDRNGALAPWLERKATKEDRLKLETLALTEMEKHHAQIDYDY